MATTSKEQDTGCNYRIVVDSNSPKPMLDDDNSQASKEHKVELTGTWDTISASAKAYHQSTQVKILEVVFDEVNIALCDLLHRLEVFNSNPRAMLTLLLHDTQNESNKRRRVDEEECNHSLSTQNPQENKKIKKIQEADSEPDPKLCGNCGGDDHKAAVCAKAGESGWMEACCKCDSMHHTYEYCPQRRQEEDFTYLILNRGNKAPVKCSLYLGRVVLLELSRRGSSYKDDQVIALPYSSTFSRQAAKVLINSSFETLMWNDAGDPVEPARRDQPLGRAVGILRDQRWTVEDHEIDRNGHPCENCWSDDHSVYNCAGPCGFCGSNNHQTLFCKRKDKSCFCYKYPGHLRWDCNKDCWFCENVLNDDSHHSVNACPRICHYCLKPDHSMENCEVAIGVTDRTCSRCPEGTYHYPLLHFELSFDKVLETAGLPRHQCQWEKTFWSSAKMGVQLTCKKNPSHSLLDSSLLVNRRSAALVTLISAAAVGDKEVSQSLECQQCRELAEGAVRGQTATVTVLSKTGKWGNRESGITVIIPPTYLIRIRGLNNFDM
ncbi:hypothetical protein GGR58DRAFT_500055 [Xylaria digitata]|nr:hypothetical protein GGR58DRAFT_500055 [Xylaria digitata]